VKKRNKMVLSCSATLTDSFWIFPNTGTAIAVIYGISLIAWAFIAYYISVYVYRESEVEAVKLTLSKVELESQIGASIADFYISKNKKKGGVNVYVKITGEPEYITVPITIQRVG